MLEFRVYVQHPPVKVPGSARQVQMASGTCRTEWDWEAQLELVATGTAWTAEEAWTEAKKQFPHPVLEFPGLRYRKPLDGEL